MGEARKRAIAPFLMLALFVISGLGLSLFAQPASAVGNRLTWSPPSLTAPTTVHVNDSNNNVVLDNSRDYRIVFDGFIRKAGGLQITGGRNVVLIGGRIEVPTAAEAPAPAARRGLYLKNQTGSIHVEGLYIGGVDLGEGINLDERLGATVTLQNIFVETVKGSQAGNHADIIQTWGGPKTLRIDGLVGSTTYQSMFLLPNQFQPVETRDWDFRNVRVTNFASSGYSIWKDDNLAISATNVGVIRADSPWKSMWPSESAWPGVSVTPEPMALSGAPGLSYATPGYAGDPTPATTPAAKAGYWMVAADGGVFSVGNVGYFGSTGSMKLNQPVVTATSTRSGNGYWLVARDGGVFSFGDAAFHGSTGNMKLNQPVVGMARTPSGNGYWMVASDGGIFSFGDAAFYGSTGAMKLNQPIVGMTPTSSGRGYWLVAADGGVFSFGDAGFYGSTGNIRLRAPIVGMSATASGRGYRFVARDGGVFNFGDAHYFGSAANTIAGQAAGIRSTASGNGYWVTSNTGWVGSYGDAQPQPSLDFALNAEVVATAAPFN